MTIAPRQALAMAELVVAARPRMESREREGSSWPSQKDMSTSSMTQQATKIE